MSTAHQCVEIDIRRRLKEIVSLPEVPEEDGDANERLGRFIQFFESVAAGSSTANGEIKIDPEPDENITPLLLACDKSSSAALRYLKSQLEAGAIEVALQAWGGPRDPSFCGNTPSHHAAASGLCEYALDVLHDYQTLLIEGGHGVTGDPCRRFISLVTEENQHGDTPFMMAAASGQTSMFRHVLSRSLHLAMSGEANRQSLDDCVEVVRKALKSGLGMKNAEGCNVLNLACGHGHLDTVTFLVQSQKLLTSAGKVVRICEKGDEPEDDAFRIDFGPLVDVSYGDVEFCRSTIENLEGGLAFMKQHKQGSRVLEFEAQISQANACLLVLESEIDRISSLAASDLLIANEGQASLEGPSSSKLKKRKKKKKGKCKAKQNRPPDDVSAEGSSGNTEGGIEAKEQAERRPPSPANQWKAVGGGGASSLLRPFVTLSDGTVVSRSSRAEYLASLAPATPDGGDSTPGADGPSGLRRILESTRGGGGGPDLESAMESLCLDPSMLLLSEHSLALEMSPCQLEQIEAILKHQTGAVRAARLIQKRLLDAKVAGE